MLEDWGIPPWDDESFDKYPHDFKDYSPFWKALSPEDVGIIKEGIKARGNKSHMRQFNRIIARLEGRAVQSRSGRKTHWILGYILNYLGVRDIDARYFGISPYIPTLGEDRTKVLEALLKGGRYISKHLAYTVAGVFPNLKMLKEYIRQIHSILGAYMFIVPLPSGGWMLVRESSLR